MCFAFYGASVISELFLSIIDLGDKRVLFQPLRNLKIISRCIKVLYTVKKVKIVKDSITRRKPLRTSIVWCDIQTKGSGSRFQSSGNYRSMFSGHAGQPTLSTVHTVQERKSFLYTDLLWKACKSTSGQSGRWFIVSEFLLENGLSIIVVRLISAHLRVALEEFEAVGYSPLPILTV